LDEVCPLREHDLKYGSVEVVRTSRAGSYWEVLGPLESFFSEGIIVVREHWFVTM
jgi:hypothetical protein